MKKIMTAVFVISLQLHFIGCDKNTDPVSSSDQLLEQKIVGTWEDANHSITFFSDHSFSDVQTGMDIFGTVGDTTPDTIIMVGNYHVTDGILQYTDINISRVSQDTGYGAFGIHPFDMEISISDNTLSMKPMLVLYATTNNPQSLRGTWMTEHWYCTYVPNGSKYYNGKSEEIYTFGDDTTKCQYHIKSSDNSEYSYELTYSYNAPILNIPMHGVANYKVEFRPYKMIWYTDNPMLILTRK